MCPGCQHGEFVADALLGLGGFLTARARRLVCLCGTQDSFGRAERMLRELAGWSVDAETIRRASHAEAARLARVRDEILNTAERFTEAPGDWELQIDAGKVNTETGWRDVKVGVFARRERAVGVSALGHQQRDLPKPSVRSMRAAIEPAEAFGLRCRAEADRLAAPGDESVSVLGDGAEWIWNLAEHHFPGAEQVLDVFHASQYLADLARAGCGEDAAAAAKWLDEARTALVADGWAGVCEYVMTSASEMPDRAAMEAAFPKVANYLAGHQDRLHYAARLRRGQAIGSGLIEGTIKQTIGRRMKQTGARWRADHVGPFAELWGLANGEEWDHYWSAA